MTIDSEIIFRLDLSESKSNLINIIHFNDAYNIECRDTEPVGGAARFFTALNEISEKEPTLIFFSGDALSPSKFEFSF